MRAAVLALATLALALPAQAGPDKAQLFKRANDAAQVCLGHMPDSRATGEALKAEGFRFEQADGGDKIYTAEGRRVAVMISSVTGASEACGIVVSKMTPQEAEALLQPWLKASGARPTTPAPGQKGKRWAGALKGAQVIVGYFEQIDLGLVSGAAIVAGRRK